MRTVLAPWQRSVLLLPKYCLTDQQFPVNGLSLYDLVAQLKDLSMVTFYSYKGSLTTPPCFQSVNWIVLEEAISARNKEVNDVLFQNSTSNMSANIHSLRENVFPDLNDMRL